MEKHMMVVERQRTGETHFTCHERSCGRRLVFGSDGDLTIVAAGDPNATHIGSTGQFALELSA